MIENIRKRRGLLIFLIGLGMLMFLIPYDAVMGLFGGTPGSESMGEFNGQTLTQASYQNMMGKYRNCGLFDNNDAGAERTAWNNFALETVYGPELESASYQIGPEEFSEIMFGQNVSDWAKSVYYRNQDPTPEAISGIEDYFDEINNLQRNTQKEMISLEYNKQKLEKLIKSGFYANTLDAEREYLGKNDKVTLEYVAVKYANVSDSLVNVTDGDVRSYFNSHKNDLEFKQNPFREVSLVKYEVTPTSLDSSSIVQRLDGFVDDFRKAPSDSAFLVNEGFGYAEQAYNPGTLAGKFDSLLTKGSAGTIVGPYVEGGEYKFSKIVRKDRIVEEAKGRHIFLSAGFRETDSVKVIADSLKQLLADGANFGSLASKFSADDTTATSGGNLGWTKIEELEPGTTGQEVKQLIADADKGQTYVAKVAGGGIPNSARIASWAYRSNTDINDISEVLSVGNDFYVAVLTKVQDSEVPEFSVVEDKMREGALKQAKFEYISKQMTSGDLATASLEEINKAIEGAEKRSGSAKANSSNLSGVGGNEALAAGAALGAPEGKISAPVMGNEAVIMYKVKDVTYADLQTNYAEDQSTLQKKFEGYAGRVRTTAQNKLVKDLRYKF